MLIYNILADRLNLTLQSVDRIGFCPKAQEATKVDGCNPTLSVLDQKTNAVFVFRSLK
jgi:hypothetical protein